MKNTFSIILLVLLTCGMFGADADEEKSVMEGDSVTLNPDLTQIQTVILILWRFKDEVIAQISDNKISYPSQTEISRDRLQLEQTGSLTIKNMRTKHSGLYELQISHSAGTSYRKFRVTVYESPSVVDAGEAEMKSVSVTEGDPVTLHVPQLQGNELIVWGFGDEGKLIAKHDIEAKSSPLYDTDERFRDRLQLYHQTGSLIITNTRTTDSGLYTVKISSNKQTLYKRFTVTVSVVPVLSPAAVAVIVLVVLLVSAAAAAGVIYYRRPKISNLPKQTLTVTEGESVTLNPDTEIQTGDQIQWLFGDKEPLIAEIKGKNREMTKYEGPDWRFRDRLELDRETGSLTISYITTAHTGVYTLKIRRGRETLYKRFFISVKERRIEVLEGESVTLKPAAEIKKDAVILWLFGDEELLTGIAEINLETGRISTPDHVAGGIFKDRLELDKTTGSLTIRNTRTTDSGLYKLEIRSSSGDSEQTFIITVKVEEKLLNEGDPVTLNPDTEIQRDDQILWMFGDENDLIAQIKGGTAETYDDVNKRFRDRLKLDKTGSLTITNITAEHTGLYKVLTSSSSRGILCKKFKILMQLTYVEVRRGDSVHLKTGLTGIQRNDEIQWRFGDENSLIAEIKGGTGKTYDGPDGRFRDRLELNMKTGDLTIKHSAVEHAGHYKLKIRSSKENTNRTYTVTIRGAAVTDEVREKSVMKEKNEKRVNESATVVMPLLNGEDPDGVNEDYVNVMNEEGTSSL